MPLLYQICRLSRFLTRVPSPEHASAIYVPRFLAEIESLYVNLRFWSLQGPFHAGKSSAVSMMTGLTTPTAGDVTIIGTSIVHQPQAARFGPLNHIMSSISMLACLSVPVRPADESQAGKPEQQRTLPPPPPGSVLIVCAHPAKCVFASK